MLTAYHVLGQLEADPQSIANDDTLGSTIRYTCTALDKDSAAVQVAEMVRMRHGWLRAKWVQGPLVTMAGEPTQ